MCRFRPVDSAKNVVSEYHALSKTIKMAKLNFERLCYLVPFEGSHGSLYSFETERATYEFLPSKFPTRLLCLTRTAGDLTSSLDGQN